MKKIQSKFRGRIKSICKKAYNTKDKLDQTPLHIASYIGDFRIVKTLVENGCDMTLKDSQDRTAIEIASTKVVMKYLSNLNTEAKNKSQSDYMLLVNSGFKAIKPTNVYLMTSAHVAVRSDHDMLETVLENDNSPAKRKKILAASMQFATKNFAQPDSAKYKTAEITPDTLAPLKPGEKAGSSPSKPTGTSSLAPSKPVEETKTSTG